MVGITRRKVILCWLPNTSESGWNVPSGSHDDPGFIRPSPRMQFEDGVLPAGPPAASMAGATAAGAGGSAGQCSLVRCSRVATWGLLTNRNSLPGFT